MRVLPATAMLLLILGAISAASANPYVTVLLLCGCFCVAVWAR